MRRRAHLHAPNRGIAARRRPARYGSAGRPPVPVPLRVYDETLAVLRRAVDRARLGQDDRLVAIRRLDAEARRLEAVALQPDYDAFVDAERAASRSYGGRSVLDR